MNEPMNDCELKSILSSWKAPEPNPAIAERTWIAHEHRSRPGWTRALQWRVSLPVPVAATAGLLLLTLGAAGGFAIRPQSAPPIIVRTETVVPATAAPPKVVTRTIFVRQRTRRHEPLTLAGFRPIREIRPEIIRSH